MTAGVPAFPDTPRPDTWSHPWGIAAGHTWTISNRFVNSFRYGLTREAFTQQGDAAKNEVYFRFIFFPVLDSRTLSRLTPTHNFTDDFSWTVGNHSAQFGTNVRVIRNERTSFANAFDLAYTNPSYYEDSGSILSNVVNDFSPLQDGQESIVQAATAALLGRLTTYEARFTFDRDGTLLPPGSPTAREFATEEYDFYGQDVWKIQAEPVADLRAALRAEPPGLRDERVRGRAQHRRSPSTCTAASRPPRRGATTTSRCSSNSPARPTAARTCTRGTGTTSSRASASRGRPTRRAASGARSSANATSRSSAAASP